MTWLAVAALAFAAEFAGDVLAVYYQTAVRKFWRRKAVQWAVCLGALGWVDLGGAVHGWPISALIMGSLAGAACGTWYAVGREMVRARLRRKRRKEAGKDAG